MAPYRDLLTQCPENQFPLPDELQKLLPPGCRNTQGQAIKLVDSRLLPGLTGDGAYEQEIAVSGRVSTRPGSLHDLCNALVWARFPRLKATLNRRHIDALPRSVPGRRGSLRDALTLFDECGMVVACADEAPLRTLAEHNWRALFGVAGECWPESVHVCMVGHGNLEALAEPYPGMISQCILLHTPGGISGLAELDEILAKLWRQAPGLSRPGQLCAFPFAGIPGWWHGPQDMCFYDDQDVFRPPRPGRPTPPVWSIPS